MKNAVYSINIPQLYNPYDRDEILCALEALVISAYRLAGVIDVGCTKNHVLYEDYDDPAEMYVNSYDELIELVGGYNHNIIENNLNIPQIRLIVDEDKTKVLGEDCKYPVYMVVYESN